MVPGMEGGGGGGGGEVEEAAEEEESEEESCGPESGGEEGCHLEGDGERGGRTEGKELVRQQHMVNEREGLEAREWLRSFTIRHCLIAIQCELQRGSNPADNASSTLKRCTTIIHSVETPQWTPHILMDDLRHRSAFFTMRTTQCTQHDALHTTHHVKRHTSKPTAVQATWTHTPTLTKGVPCIPTVSNLPAG